MDFELQSLLGASVYLIGERSVATEELVIELGIDYPMLVDGKGLKSCGGEGLVIKSASLRRFGRIILAIKTLDYQPNQR